MAANTPTRPLPELRNAGAPYWRAAARGQLVVPLCRACSRTFWHPRLHCPYCGSNEVEWTPSSGKGVVHTFTVVRNSSDPFFKAKAPYVVAMVQLEDGPLLMSNITGCDADAVSIGMRVAARFEPASDEVAVPIFVPDSK